MNIIIMTRADHPPNALIDRTIEHEYLGHITNDMNAKVMYRSLLASMMVYDHGTGGKFEINTTKEKDLLARTFSELMEKKWVVTRVDNERDYYWTANPEIVAAAQKGAWVERAESLVTPGLKVDVVMFKMRIQI